MTKGDSKSSKKTEKDYSFDFLIENDPPTRTDFLNNLSKHLATLRQMKGWTQDKLNYRLGIADRLMNKWECGDKTPSGFNLYCWADALGEQLITMPKDTVYCEFTLSDGEKVKRWVSIAKEKANDGA